MQPKTFVAWLRPLFRKDRIVYAKARFGGPDHVLQYLGCYIHRVDLQPSPGLFCRWSSHFSLARFRSPQPTEAHDLPVDEFLCRFLLHLLPEGFARIRNFGFLANRKQANSVPLCFQLLAAKHPQARQDTPSSTDSRDSWPCPNCGGPMVLIERLTAAEIQLRSPPIATAAA